MNLTAIFQLITDQYFDQALDAIFENVEDFSQSDYDELIEKMDLEDVDDDFRDEVRNIFRDNNYNDLELQD